MPDALNPYNAPVAPLGGQNAMAATGGVSPWVIEHLAKTRPWVMLIGILFAIGAVFIILFGLLSLGGMASFGLEHDQSSAYIAGAAFAYILIGLLYVIPAMHLLKYSGAIKRLKRAPQIAYLEEALRHQRKFWVFTGVMGVLWVAIMILAFLSGLASAAR